MAEDDALPANAFPVSVMHMVNPSTFWVTEPLGQDMTKEREKLTCLEEMLSGHCRRSYEGVNYMPEEEELVAVQHPETGRWHRAEVEYVLHEAKGYVYKVFLVDYGLSIKVRSSAIRKLPSAWVDLDYQSFQVVLYGILPTTVDMDYKDMKMKRKVASNWTPAAGRFVKKLLEESTNFWLVYKKNIRKKIYGDLFVEVENESLSLTNELCTKEYAVYSEELFEEELEKYNMQTPSPQIPVCSEGSRTQNTSHVSSLGDTSKLRHIQDYIRECSIQQAKKGKKNEYQIKEMRRETEVTSTDINECGEHFQNGHEKPLGCGMIERMEKSTSGMHSKLTVGNVQQGEKCNENRSLKASHEGETVASSMLGLLDLIDHKSNHDSKSLSEMSTSCNLPRDGKNFSCTNYFPAGATYRKSKDPVVINSRSLRDKGTHTFDARNGSYSVQFKNTRKPGSTLGMILPHYTTAPLDTKRSEIQSSAVKVSENFEQIEAEKQHRPLSFLECLQGKTNSMSENGSCRTEKGSDVQEDVTEKEITSVSTRNIFQDIVNSVAKSTKTKRQDLLDDVKKNSLSPSSIPDMKARLPQTTLKAMLKQGTPGNGIQANSNSLASVKDSAQIPTACVGYKVAEQHKTSRILVHGNMGFRAIQSVAEANFPTEIHQAVAKMDIKDPMRIQTYAWPAIMRGQYTVLVGPPQSGKTLAYIIPVVSFMLTPDFYSELRPGNGPLVLVLCSGSKSAQFVYEKCCTLLKFSSQNKVRVEIAYGGGREQELRDPLANGCDILISTPRCFMRLLRCSRLITNVDRLAHLVLDEVDILAHKFLSELKGVITECKQMLVRRAKVGVPVQVIAVSEKWCPAVEQFSQHISHNFLVCISGYLEAAVYSKLQPTLHLLSTSSKPEAVLDILDGYHGQHKTVIVCRSVADVDHLVPFLESHCFQVLAAHEDMTHCHITEISQRWKCAIVPGAFPILVCTDDVLPELDVSDAMWLIHYSLPRTKTGFGFRFSCLMSNYPNMFDKSTCNSDPPECRVHIFADKDQCTRELPEVVHFLKRLSVPVAPEIEAKVMEILLQKESQKLAFPLCYCLKAFGECLERTVCRSRHVIVDAIDRPCNIPFRGDVKVKILHVHNAGNFSARLLEHTDVGGRPVIIPDEYLTVNMAMYSHYSDEKNRLLHGIPKLGDICSVETKINIFQRVQVVEVVKEDTKGIPEELKIKFLDEGIFTVVKVYQLLALPEDLQKLPPQVVDIFLCNVIPCDLDTDWSETVNCKMNDWIDDINSGEVDGKFLVGKVMLSAGNTLWLEPLEYRNYLTSLDTYVVELSLSKELVKCGFGVSNPGHLKKLYELCHVGGLAVPTYEKVPMLEKVQHEIKRLPSPQWAHLDNKEFQEIVFVCADNPHQFFIRHYKFNVIFQRLIDELQKCVKTKPNNFHLEKGSYCLGKFPEDGMWYRAQVDQLVEDDHASLFFVDHGDKARVSISDIAPITEMLIKKLPFQAIECSLAGIKPPDGGTWSAEATDVMYEFCDNSYGLYVKVCEVMTAAVCTGGCKYKVMLVDNTSTNVDIYLNSVLLEKNLALPDNIEQILETLDPVCLEGGDTSEESDVEPEETRIVELSDISVPQHSQVNAASPSAEDSISDDEEYDILVDDPLEFLMEMMRGNKKCEPSLPAVPALPTPSSLPSSDDHNLEGASASCISPQHLSSNDKSDIDCIPPLVSTARTPQVLWHQDECIIYIKIMLTGVQKYYIGWDVMHLQFSTQMNSQVYEVMLELYSSVNVSSITHTAKGFFVHIKLMKTVTGFSWPRLLQSQCKRPWLKLDLEKYKGDFDSDEDNAKTRCERALKELSLSNKESQVPAPNLKDEAVISSVPISSSDDDEEEEEEDGMNLQDESYDPFDPLS